MKWLILLLLLPGCAVRDVPLSCGTPDAEWMSRVVHITGDGDGAGSGVLLGDGRVLSAAHVFHDEEALGFEWGGERYELADLTTGAEGPMDLSETPASDWGLASSNARLDTVPLLRDSLVVGEQVWAVGWPLSFPQISSEGRYWGDYLGIAWTTVPVTSGISGGALLACREGRHVLAGVLSVVASRPLLRTFGGTVTQEINFMSGAVHVRDIPL